MYSPAVTAAAVEDASRQQILAQRAAVQAGTRKRPPVGLQYHSRAQIDHAISHLDSLRDAESGALRRPYKQDEIDFITNERKICALDFDHWSRHYAYIVDWRKQKVRFAPNVSQGIIIQLWGETEAERRAIWMQQLKARRLGVSTVNELAVLHRFQFYPNTNAVVASADPEKSTLMAGMINYAYEQQPWWLKPVPTKIHRGIPAEFGEINTGLSIQAGNQFNGVARGATPNVFHGSELCEWLDAELLIDSALMRAILDNEMTFGVLESTALGRGNWWHRTWKQTKADWDRGRARMRPVFLPWYVGTDLYPTAADLIARPVPHDWIPSDRTIHHAERARAYVLGNPLLFKYLAKGNTDWRMPREQMWFWEIEYETAREKKQLNLFFSELCSDDIEAFQSSKISVVDQEILLSYRERTRPPLAAYTIIGDGIPDALVAPRRQWDRSKSPITVNIQALLHNVPARYQFIPLIVDDYFGNFDPMLKLLVWEFPQEDTRYGIGVDTSDGIGQDRAAIEVLRQATVARCTGQVAELVSPYIKAFQLWPLTLAISTFYSTYQMRLGRRQQARVAIEIKGNGETVQYELQKRGWSDFHPWKRYDNRKPTPDGSANKMGVYTNVWFRAQGLDMLLAHVDEETIDLPSRFFVEELETLERDPGQQKIMAGDGEYDDRILAGMFPLFSLHIGQTPSQQHARPRVDFLPGGEPAPVVAGALWRPPAITVAGSGPHESQQILPRKIGRTAGALLRYVNPRMPEGFR